MRFSKILMEDNKYDLLSDYSQYHLERMDPGFYNLMRINQQGNLLPIETMMYHKDLHDECLLIITSQEPTDQSIMLFLDKLIKHYEDLEEFESCSYLKNIQSTL